MIHDYSCTGVRDRLEAFHDGELTVHDRVALQNHLDECSICNHVSNELASVGSCAAMISSTGSQARSHPADRFPFQAITFRATG